MKKYLKNNLEDIDKVLFFVSVALLIFGLLNIVTASSSTVVLRYNKSLYSYFYKQAIFLIIGAVMSVIIINVPTKSYKKLSLLFFLIILGSLIYLLIWGAFKKGSKNWIPIGIFSFQPSEFAKPVMIMCLSVIFDVFNKKFKNKKISHYDMIGVVLFVGVIYPLIVFLQKDLGTAIIIFMIFAMLFIASPILPKEKFRTCIAGIFLIMFFAIVLLLRTGSVLSSTQKSRFDFFDPCSKYEEGGYQICNGFIAINGGGLLGIGIGESKQISYIPESHTDSVFAIIAEEYGFIRCTFIFLGYIIILYRILKLSSRANTVRGRYLTLGIATYIFLHIFVNLGGLFGVMPLTGVPLPFLSYGGSFTISLIISLSIVQRVHIETKNQYIKIK